MAINIEKKFLLKNKDLYKIKSFPHTLDQQIFLKKIMWKSCEKFFFEGEIFSKISNFFYLSKKDSLNVRHQLNLEDF